MDIPLPVDKLSLGSLNQDGSSNSVTKIGKGCIELRRRLLHNEGYISPMNDTYKKRGLISAEQRIQMCHLACKSSSFVMVDPWEVKTICRDYGVVCVRREGKNVEKIISSDDFLNENKNNIKIVDELVPNQISSTRVRECILRGLSVKYLTADEVIDYIRQECL